MVRRAGTSPFLEAADALGATPVVEATIAGPLDRQRMAAPAHVRMMDGRLEWTEGDGDDRAFTWWRAGGKASRALWAFIRLADDPSDERIAVFARRYGVLGINEFGLPSLNHISATVPQLSEPWHGWAVSWEPVAVYRIYAARAKAFVALAAALRVGGPVDPHRELRAVGLDLSPLSWDDFKIIVSHWQRASGLDWDAWWRYQDHGQALGHLTAATPANIADNLRFPDLTAAERATRQRRNLAFMVNRFWLGLSGLRPELDWENDRPRLRLSVGSSTLHPTETSGRWPPNALFPVLAAHLAAFVCAGAERGVCRNCGAVFFRERRVRLDIPQYCETCAQTAASRRQQRWREGKRQGT
ncbi:MAG: hypothetical protein ACR2OO_14305 [Thermomicrobiales bacterium]